MANIYHYVFTVTCPNNSRVILYDLEIVHKDMVMVEDIIAACSELPSCFQEEIADRLYERFGGYQVIKAHHHGVNVETRRGEQIV